MHKRTDCAGQQELKAGATQHHDERSAPVWTHWGRFRFRVRVRVRQYSTLTQGLERANLECIPGVERASHRRGDRIAGDEERNRDGPCWNRNQPLLARTWVREEEGRRIHRPKHLQHALVEQLPLPPGEYTVRVRAGVVPEQLDGVGARKLVTAS